MRVLSVQLLVIAAALSASADTHWIDPTDFAERGGWKLDTQFVYLMGSPYLLATGANAPVDDAWTDVDVAKPGRYRVWARVRDWLPEHHPGRFQILVNGEPLARELGVADRDDWHWVAVGDVSLEERTIRITLHDLTGGFGRCAGIIVTSDMNYVPPREVDAVVAERARLRGIDTRPKPMGRFDVVVVGGGPAGCPAAIAAARMGARTALIQDRPVLGGNASNELGVPMEGASILNRNARETGIVEEASRVRVQNGFPKMSEPFRLLTDAEPNLTVFLNTRMIGVTMASASRIESLRTVHVLDGTYGEFQADYVVDCTGDGWVGYYAGAQYRLGREAKWEYNEQDAPEQPDGITMSGCIMGGDNVSYRAEDTGKPVAYVAPAWAAPIPDLHKLKRFPRNMVTGEWWMEHPGIRDDLYNAEEARDELVRITFGYWDYIKNRWPNRKRAERYALTKVPYINAKRESRRLVGDYMLTENDVLENTHFPDTVAYAGWPMDIHNPNGIYKGPEGPYHTNHNYPGLCRIPFSCLYSVNVDNLLFAGRCASVTHLALGAVRVERTLCTLGQAAGTGAALCARHDMTPRQLRADRIQELQQTLLKNDQYIPDRVNQDPNDLARSATVAASSAATEVTFTADNVRPGRMYHALDHHRAFMFPTVRPVKSASLLLKSTADAPVTARLHLRGSEAAGDFSATDDIAVAEAAVPAGRESWVTFAFNAGVAVPFAWVYLEPVEGVSWRLMDSSFGETFRAYASRGADSPLEWIVRHERYCCYFDPPAGVRVDCSPENVVNGISRTVGGDTNLWKSDPAEGWPQWIELAFPEKVMANTAQVTFGTDINARRLSKVKDPNTGETVLPIVSDYTLSAFDGTSWREIVEVKDNYQRWRRHTFDAREMERLRVTVTGGVGVDAAEVCEIRVYDE
ncbi:MAG: FAD-dependent oxidoreductase [bacterium]|nr:FAD-dependent oxidoreductase [bacterium]